MEMSKSKNHSDYDAIDFTEDESVENELDNEFDLDFNDSKVMKRMHKAKSRYNARRRIEDYFERKALKEQENEWDFNLDY